MQRPTLKWDGNTADASILGDGYSIEPDSPVSGKLWHGGDLISAATLPSLWAAAEAHFQKRLDAPMGFAAAFGAMVRDNGIVVESQDAGDGCLYQFRDLTNGRVGVALHCSSSGESWQPDLFGPHMPEQKYSFHFDEPAKHAKVEIVEAEQWTCEHCGAVHLRACNKVTSWHCDECGEVMVRPEDTQ